MKLLFASLMLSLVFGGLFPANAQQQGESRAVKVKVGKQKKETNSGLTIKFLSLEEDSRCATGANCVWAGNAKIKVSLKLNDEPPATFEMNTNDGAKGTNCGPYAVYLTGLTPTPKSNVRLNRNAYTAVFSVTYLSR